MIKISKKQVEKDFAFCCCFFFVVVCCSCKPLSQLTIAAKPSNFDVCWGPCCNFGSDEVTATGLEPRTTLFLNEHSTIWPN